MLKHAFAIGFDDARVSVSVMLIQPTQQCRTEIKIDVCVVVDELFIGTCLADANKCIGPITFEMNSLVPIVERRGARLRGNDSGPRIFARRLIEVAVNDERGHDRLKENLATKKHKRHKRESKTGTAKFSFCAFCAFLWLIF